MICPLRNVVIREDQLPWVSKTLRQLISRKERQFKKACKTQAMEDWEKLHELKVSSRKMFNRNKRQFIISKLNETRNDPKQFGKR